MTGAAEDRIFQRFAGALAESERFEEPYRHWILRRLLPEDILSALQEVDLPVPDLGGVSGKRELHNAQRSYVDRANMAHYPAMAALGRAFQAPRTIRVIEDFFSADLEGAFLRIEYAQDVTGFWLHPHTDLGAKRLTVLFYISDSPGQETLGTDIYARNRSWAKRTLFAPNAAMAFVPSSHTYHGFEKRRIEGVRRSLILNYVTDEWRDREQLAFPHEAVSAKR